MVDVDNLGAVAVVGSSAVGVVAEVAAVVVAGMVVAGLVLVFGVVVDAEVIVVVLVDVAVTVYSKNTMQTCETQSKGNIVSYSNEAYLNVVGAGEWSTVSAGDS